MKTEKDASAQPLHPSFVFRRQASGLILSGSQFLDIDSMFLCQALADRGLVKLLTSTEFFHYTGSFKFSLEFLEGALDVFALLHGYYNHFCLLFLFRYYLFRACFGVQMYAINSYSANFGYDFSSRPVSGCEFTICTVC